MELDSIENISFKIVIGLFSKVSYIQKLIFENYFLIKQFPKNPYLSYINCLRLILVGNRSIPYAL